MLARYSNIAKKIASFHNIGLWFGDASNSEETWQHLCVLCVSPPGTGFGNGVAQLQPKSDAASQITDVSHFLETDLLGGRLP